MVWKIRGANYGKGVSLLQDLQAGYEGRPASY
jgi:hypothetical protein